MPHLDLHSLGHSRSGRCAAGSTTRRRAWGAALAFYTMLSLAPLLLVAVGIAGFFVGRDEAQNALITQLALSWAEKGRPSASRGLLDAAGSREEGLHARAHRARHHDRRRDHGVRRSCAATSTASGAIARRATGGLANSSSRAFFSFLLVMGIGALLLISLAASTFLATLGNYWFGRRT
jgi:membrane protein